MTFSFYTQNHVRAIWTCGLLATIMTALWIACGEDTNSKHRVSLSTDSVGTQQPRAQVQSLFTELRQREPEGLFKVYIQNRFNNNNVIYGNVLLKSYKQQQLYLCKQNLIVQKSILCYLL